MKYRDIKLACSALKRAQVCINDLLKHLGEAPTKPKKKRKAGRPKGARILKFKKAPKEKPQW